MIKEYAIRILENLKEDIKSASYIQKKNTTCIRIDKIIDGINNGFHKED